MRTITIIAFIFLVLLQLYVPASMIMEQENIISSGREFKFKTAPVDPYDYFRGKYITLSFEAESWTTDSSWSDNYQRDVYALLETDSLGFARIKSVSLTVPENTADYIKAKESHYYPSEDKLFLDFPFNRFYMEESKAYDAEKTYNMAARDTNSVAYAQVHVLDGDAVVTDVLIDGVSVKDLAKSGSEK
jgi:uncharacterized membrane-anchored protein